MQWRKLRTAAAQYLGLDDADVDEATRRERRRKFLAATASPRSPLASGRTGSGGSTGSEKEGSPTAADRQRQQELIPTKSWEKRRSASPPVRLPPQVVPVATRSPEERSPPSDDDRRSWNGQTAVGRAKQQRRPLPPPKVGRQAGRHARRHACMQAGTHARRHARRHARTQVCLLARLNSVHLACVVCGVFCVLHSKTTADRRINCVNTKTNSLLPEEQEPLLPHGPPRQHCVR